MCIVYGVFIYQNMFHFSFCETYDVVFFRTDIIDPQHLSDLETFIF